MFDYFMCTKIYINFQTDNKNGQNISKRLNSNKNTFYMI